MANGFDLGDEFYLSMEDVVVEVAAGKIDKDELETLVQKTLDASQKG